MHMVRVLCYAGMNCTTPVLAGLTATRYLYSNNDYPSKCRFSQSCPVY